MDGRREISQMSTQEQGAKKDKFEVNIEGRLHEWPKSVITVPELRELAGYGSDQQVIEVDLKDNSEKILGEDDKVELKPGKGFAKKVEFKRG
jgi:hypothetical protein